MIVNREPWMTADRRPQTADCRRQKLIINPGFSLGTIKEITTKTYNEKGNNSNSNDRSRGGILPA